MYNPQITVDRIKEMRVIRKVSSTLLNESCNLNKNTVATSANSKTGLSAKILFDIAETLNCSVDYLLGRTTEPSINTNNNIKITNGNISNGSVVQTNGNINQQYIGGGASANTTHDTKKTADSISEKFMEIFNNLPFEEQLAVMNFAVGKSKKGELK